MGRYELITYGRFPYPRMKNAQVLDALQTGYRMPCPMGCPEQLYWIMRECWMDDADRRPTFASMQYRLETFYAPKNSYAPERMTLEEFRSTAGIKDINLCNYVKLPSPIVYADVFHNETGTNNS